MSTDTRPPMSESRSTAPTEALLRSASGDDSPHPSDLTLRTRKVLQTSIEFLYSPTFDSPEIDREIRQTLVSLTASAPLDPQLPKDLPGHLARLCEAARLTPQEEPRLFRCMNYLKFRAQGRRQILHPERPVRKLLVSVEEDLRNAETIRNRIIRSNTRLVFSVIRKFVNPQHSFDDLLSDGIVSLIRAVDKFDCERGFRFSTYAYRAITRNTCRKLANRQKELSRQVAAAHPPIDEVLQSPVASGMNERTWTQLNGLLTQMIGRLDRREQLILRSRHGLGCHRTTHTFQDIANRLGISKERVRQLEQRAIHKLRTWAAEQPVQEILEPLLL